MLKDKRKMKISSLGPGIRWPWMKPWKGPLPKKEASMVSIGDTILLAMQRHAVGDRQRPSLEKSVPRVLFQIRKGCVKMGLRRSQPNIGIYRAWFGYAA